MMECKWVMILLSTVQGPGLVADKERELNCKVTILFQLSEICPLHFTDSGCVCMQTGN